MSPYIQQSDITITKLTKHSKFAHVQNKIGPHQKDSTYTNLPLPLLWAITHARKCDGKAKGTDYLGNLDPTRQISKVNESLVNELKYCDKNLAQR